MGTSFVLNLVREPPLFPINAMNDSAGPPHKPTILLTPLLFGHVLYCKFLSALHVQDEDSQFVINN